MKEFLVQMATIQLNVSTLGEGEIPLLAFHGIGQTGVSCFESWEKTLAAHYRIYLFDLPFHGKSRLFFEDERWENGNRPLLETEWYGYLDQFLDDNKIDRFSVVGFSLGGRFALETLALFPTRIINTFLIAPDGIVDQPFFRLATSTRFFRSLFKVVTSHPEALINTAEFLRRIGVVHASLVKTIRFVASEGQFSETVFRSWVNFRKLGYRLPGEKKMVPEFLENVFVILGQYDRLVQLKDVAPMVARIPKHNFIRLKAGHGSLVGHAADEILGITLNYKK